MRIIAGEARGKPILGPRGRTTRPALDRMRESIFGHLEGVFEDREVLDLFAGVGSFGLEAISRGARRAVFVERSRTTLRLLRQNIELLAFSGRAEVLAADALSVPDPTSAPPEGYALVFLDPPFKMFTSPEDTGAVLRRLDELRSGPLLAPDGRLLLRYPSRWRDGLPATATLERRFGESVVVLFARE